MAVRVYGPDPFTVGADVNLEVYDAANWAEVPTGGGAKQSVRAATDDLRNANAVASSVYKYTGVTLVDQRIVAAIKTGPNANSFPGLRNRQGATEQDGYLCEWDQSLNDLVLYRVTNGAAPIFTIVVQGGAIALSTTYTNAYLKAIGTNPVQLEAGDDTNGIALLTFSDSNAARWQSGQPGTSLYNDTALSCALDDVEVWNEAVSVQPYRSRTCLAIQQRAP